MKALGYISAFLSGACFVSGLALLSGGGKTHV